MMPGFAAMTQAQKTAHILGGRGVAHGWSAMLRGESETEEEYWDRLSEEWLVKDEESDERGLNRQDSRPEERVSRPMPPVPALRTCFEESVIVPVQCVPVLRTVSPVHLHSPVRPVPAPRTCRAKVVLCPAHVVPALRSKRPVRLHGPVRPVQSRHRSGQIHKRSGVYVPHRSRFLQQRL